MKNIIVLGVVISIINLAILSIAKVLDLINDQKFGELLSDSFLVIFIIFVATLLINLIMNSFKNEKNKK